MVSGGLGHLGETVGSARCLADSNQPTSGRLGVRRDDVERLLFRYEACGVETYTVRR